jgi:hypothetical protein
VGQRRNPTLDAHPQPGGPVRRVRPDDPVSVLALAYLGLMLLNVVAPTGLTSPRGYFYLDWITLLVMVVVAVVGAVCFFVTRPDRRVGEHLHDDAEPTGAERA